MKNKSFFQRLVRYYLLYTVGFVLFLFGVAILEHEGFPRVWIAVSYTHLTLPTKA